MWGIILDKAFQMPRNLLINMDMIIGCQAWLSFCRFSQQVTRDTGQRQLPR